MKNLFVLILGVIISIHSFDISAQESRFNIKVSYGNAASVEKNLLQKETNEYFTESLSKTTSHFRLEGNYSITNNLETGVYVGLSRLKTNILNHSFDNYAQEDFYFYSHGKSMALYYGINLNCQLLPLITGQKNLRFELYPTVKIGFISEYWKEPENDLPLSPFKKISNTSFECGAGLGFGYKFTRAFGVFGEGTFGKFHNDQFFRFHAGVQFNF